MKDIIGKYKKRKTISNLAIIVTSLVLAFSMNFFVISPNDLAQNMKSNVLEAKTDSQKADFYLELKAENNINLKTNTSLKDVKNITLSLAYDPENTSLEKLSTKLDGNINYLSNTPGITMVILDFPTSMSFKKADNILEITTSKKETKSEQLNIIKATFTDTKGEIYAPTISGITF